MAEPPEPPGDLTAAVRELSGADVLAFGGVGLAGQVLPPTAAYQAVEAALPRRAAEVRPGLDWLLGHGSPAGRAYAATLLGRLDPAAGRAAWRSLLRQPGTFTSFFGCVMGQETLGEYAARQLDEDVTD
jgi:hypothetical protein